MRIAELAGRRVALWGFGREGRATLAALHARLPDLPVTLFCGEDEPGSLDDPASSLKTIASGKRSGAKVPGRDGFAVVTSRVVTDPPDATMLSAFDVVIKSPGISAYRPEIAMAAKAGTRFTSGTALWFAEHPEARVIAVTGTKGKSTVSALIAHLLRALGRRTALAGNIGLPLLELLDPPFAPDWWVVELSSFQTGEAGRVAIGVFNNLDQEHLDWHGSSERYAADKLALAARADCLVVNARQSDLPARVAWAAGIDGAAAGPSKAMHRFGLRDGWHVHGDAVARDDLRVFGLRNSPLSGAHNALNLCAALAALEAAGEDAVAAAAHVATFQPLPHRLQTLGRRDDVTWIDDSIATTPQATLEALASLPERSKATLLVGGYERGLDWRPFAAGVRATPPHAIVTMGANGARIEAILRAVGGDYRLESARALADAVRIARAVTPAAGIIALSPGAPSFDAFADYVERGRAFATLAGFDADAIGGIDGLGIG
ncbi:MAG TPA: UDP-N-acetylmuramoyl-L-alanine--D-glutamate ligase [Rhodanobacteraceae bacterium]|nr:UDP-N-acetylmuramoyl-L-alanine--D-glutamate ligase [Rhodanobacteraceae bacterium]